MRLSTKKLRCSVCGAPMLENEAVEISVDPRPYYNKTLTFKLCPACQEKAKDHKLHICLGCKSTGWHPTGGYRERGVDYVVKGSCNRCATDMVSIPGGIF